jgi:adenylosuccinate synthase
VFEGGQGLGLDQVQGHVPHVTKSFTGLTNVIDICKEAGIDSLEVYYVTRAYLTRHGAGKMESELKEKPYRGIKETSNFTNEFQGKFRYGNLDVDALRERIKVDLRGAYNNGINVNPKLAVTCIDHLDEIGRYIKNGKFKRASKGAFSVTLAREVGLPFVLDCQGPTRDTVKEMLAL